ncbi:TFIIS helical bundle-like domain-containing protein [Sarocladium implicatum]|nr:TFIIS helical bundle-like domain-containing protein [Sarocladium implicatum]
MSATGSPVGSPANAPVNDGQEEEFQDAVAAADSDRDSDLLSEIDENQFEDYDPETANIEDRPVDIDEDIARTLKASKRKRADGEIPRKPREGRREKKRRDRDTDVAMGGAEDDDMAAPRRARRTGDGERRARATQSSPDPQPDEDLTPEERRKREINRQLDLAMKKPGTNRRRKKDEEASAFQHQLTDLENEIDDRLIALNQMMDRACQEDNDARGNDQPAIHKLKLLPDVVAMMNRNDVRHAVLDPDTNFLQHVKFFLEPLNDGSLPAYNIQRDIFMALTKMNVEKEALLSSGIGKVVLFYTRSKQPEASIKRMAEKLLGEWSRPILKRTDDYKKRAVEQRDYDYQAAKAAQRDSAIKNPTMRLTQRPAPSAETDRLAPKGFDNQARATNLPASYTVAPRSTFDGARGSEHRPLGASGMDAFRKMTQKKKKAA